MSLKSAPSTTARATSKVKDRELLGQGRFGQVYRGVFGDKPVALKKIQRTLLGPGEDKELSIMKKLHHPNVLRLISVEDKGEFRFLYLELCEGTLEDFFKKKYKGEMPQDSMCLYQMSSGLRYIHSLNYIHRDIKPENILIHKQDLRVQLKISDFGYCKETRTTGSYSLSGVKGTPMYLAPEMLSILDNEDVASERRATKACDVFALGCVFYKFLTRGTHPFGEDLFVTANIANGTFKLDSPKVTKEMTDLIKNMIERDPTNRPDIIQVADRVKIFDFVNQRQRCCSDGKTERVIQCRFNPVKPILACALAGGKICIFRGASSWTPFEQWKREKWKPRTSSSPQCIEWNVNGSKLAAGYGDGSLIVWTEQFNQKFQIKKHFDRITAVKWNAFEQSSSSYLITTSQEQIIVWDTATRRAVQTIYVPGEVTDVCWTSQDVFAVSSQPSTGSTIQIFQIDYGHQTITLKHTFNNAGSVHQLRFHNEQLASLSSDGIKMWSMTSSEPVRTFQVSEARCFDFCRRPDGRMILACGCGDGRLWIHRKENSKIFYEHNRGVLAVSFSPNLQFLASIDEAQTLIIRSVPSFDVIYGTKLGQSIRSDFSLSWNCGKLAITTGGSKVTVIDFD